MIGISFLSQEISSRHRNFHTSYRNFLLDRNYLLVTGIFFLCQEFLFFEFPFKVLHILGVSFQSITHFGGFSSISLKIFYIKNLKNMSGIFSLYTYLTSFVFLRRKVLILRKHFPWPLRDELYFFGICRAWGMGIACKLIENWTLCYEKS